MWPTRTVATLHTDRQLTCGAKDRRKNGSAYRTVWSMESVSCGRRRWQVFWTQGCLSNRAPVVARNLMPVLEVSAALCVSYLGNAHIQSRSYLRSSVGGCAWCGFHFGSNSHGHAYRRVVSTLRTGGNNKSGLQSYDSFVTFHHNTPMMIPIVVQVL
jgi:hypothetical protein